MADKKISQLTVAASIADGNLFAIVQSGVTKQLDYAILKADFLLKSDNLAGLADAAASRANLGGVLTSAEVDAAIDVKIAAQLSSYVMQDGDSAGGIVTFSTTTEPLTLYKSFGRVFWTGKLDIVGIIATGAYMFDLPVGFRPVMNFLDFPVTMNVALQTNVTVQTTGIVQNALGPTPLNAQLQCSTVNYQLP